MIVEMSASITLLALAMAFSGFAFGIVYFIALHRTVALFAAGGGWRSLSALTIGRIGAAIILLALAARLGMSSLLATFVGFLVARAVALHVVKREK